MLFAKKESQSELTRLALVRKVDLQNQEAGGILHYKTLKYETQKIRNGDCDRRVNVGKQKY